jgi:hypothetical protein
MYFRFSLSSGMHQVTLQLFQQYKNSFLHNHMDDMVEDEDIQNMYLFSLSYALILTTLYARFA